MKNKPLFTGYNEWNSTNLSFEELYKIGKSTSFTKVFIQKEAKMNENHDYGMILEDSALLESIELHVASEMLRSKKLDEGFRDFAKSIFGEKVVSKIEKMPAKLYTSGAEMLGKGKEIWDKTVTGFKDFMSKIGDAIKSIVDTMKAFLGQIWEMIKGVATKMGKFVFEKKAENLEKLAAEIFPANEAVEHAEPAKFVDEVKTVGQEYSEMIGKYFKRDKFEELTKQAEDAAKEIESSPEDSSKVNDSVSNAVWNSFVGLYSVSEAVEIEELFRLDEEDHGSHKKQSKVVKWIQGIVLWILSPVGALTELVTEKLTKAIMSAPSAILKGIKNATVYVHIPTVATILAGMVADIWGIKGLAGGTHESLKINESAFSDESKVKDALGAVSKVAVSGIAGFALGIAIHAVPPLAIAFESIALAGLTIMFFGWLKENHADKEWAKNIPKICTEFFHWIH